MDLALNNLQRLIRHKTHQTKPNLQSLSSPIFSLSFFFLKESYVEIIFTGILSYCYIMFAPL